MRSFRKDKDNSKSALKNIKTNSSFNVSRIDQIEKEVKHDVIAFLTNIAENVGADSKFIHMVTSSDIIDTALSIQLKQSSKIIKELKNLIECEARAKNIN